MDRRSRNEDDPWQPQWRDESPRPRDDRADSWDAPQRPRNMTWDDQSDSMPQAQVVRSPRIAPRKLGLLAGLMLALVTVLLMTMVVLAQPNKAAATTAAHITAPTITAFPTQTNAPSQATVTPLPTTIPTIAQIPDNQPGTGWTVDAKTAWAPDVLPLLQNERGAAPRAPVPQAIGAYRARGATRRYVLDDAVIVPVPRLDRSFVVEHREFRVDALEQLRNVVPDPGAPERATADGNNQISKPGADDL